MARAFPNKPAYELSDAEKRDLTQLIQQGKPLPEKYRFILFEDKREVELVWNGKTRDVCTTVLPFQSLEHIDEPRTETKIQEDLFDSRGRQHKGWTNKLIWGDNKLILSSLKSGALRRQIEDAGGLKLIYIDPPFDVGADFSMDIEIGGETFHKEANLLEQIAYRDTWGRGADSFISMIYERLILMRDLMAADGSIYVHCDWHVSHLLRAALDEVFGRERFCNEIIWYYYNKMQGNVGRFASNHDVIFWYSKGEQKTFERVREERAETVKQLKRVWDKDKQKLVNAKGADGKVIYIETDHKTVDDVWRLSMLQPADRSENIGYATQKPESIAERILNASSKEGDLVADFFCGSGTTAAVAEKLGRKWIATDLGKFGIHTTRKRLIGVQRELKAAEKNFRAFEVLNLGRYERQAYLNVSGRLTGTQKAEALATKEREFRELILRAYKAEPLQGESFFHGKNAGRLVVVGPINLPVGRLFVEEVITECRKRGASRADVLAFEFEMGLFPAALEEAKSKGIDLTPKYIPADVFDKRAVDRGQVVFHDISFVEAAVRHAKAEGGKKLSAKEKLTITIELTDFSVYYSQGAAEAAIAAMKEGKSEVVCEQGQLIKISKDKNGIITRDVLTKEWTDWVDYWAVDFDYEQRKEIIKVPRGMGLEGTLPGVDAVQGELTDFEDRWTGGYIFENEWQSFRTRQNRKLELTTAPHTYQMPGRYKVAVKVIDIFGNDTMTLVPVSVG
ncbi:MAG: site-specific DNA-methyltransferase [Rhodocyclaceae bacterium]|nr:site-specific DNA-methyltransferase [Rhodocyclaceae bacterium]MCA3025680.1 site-specific DNA-methyltransferase [Rhodocyclaceae bacterium]MCA3033065.1 site-specific DNA-methyltransferase [Rhodocyclaceae bacterium]MCA3038409.1 site-specific DNA-methyltransferase [Rhodocyclaceae bacterium]MCA3047709.1 site-specific DNA-methyltransferase [Rhodocyclaceae bacterium]